MLYTMATHGPKQKYYYSKLRLREWGWSYNCFFSLRVLYAHYLAKNFLNVALLELYNEPIHPASSRFACRINIAMCCIHVHMLDDDASCCKVCCFFVVSLFPVAAKLTQQITFSNAATLGFNSVLITFEPTLNSIMFFKVLKSHVGCWHKQLVLQ